MNRQILESLWVLVGTIIFATSNAITKIAVLDGYHFWEILMMRSVTSVIVLGGLMLMQNTGFGTQHVKLYTMRATCGSLGSLFSVMSIAYLPIGLANTLCNSAPLFMGLTFAVVAYLNRQRQDWLVLGNLLFGFSGVALVLMPSSGSTDINLIGATAGILAAMLDTAAYWAINMLGRYNEPSQRLSFWYIAACVPLGLAGCIFYAGFTPWTTKFLLIMAIAGALHVFGIVAMTRSWAKGYIPLTGTLQFMTVVFCVLIGWLFFNDNLSARVLTGIAMVILAGIVSTLARIRKKN